MLTISLVSRSHGGKAIGNAGNNLASLKKYIGDHLLLNPDNEPKPQPQPIRDPCGYMNGLEATMLVAYRTRCCTHDGHAKDRSLKEALESFGVDIEGLFFARIMHTEEVAGLTLMERFMNE
jgi:hypothetical protein